MKTLLLTAASLLALAGNAHAQRETKITGAFLGNLCISKEQNKAEACRAYLSGIADAVGFYQRLLPADGSKGAKLPEYVCIPGTVSGPQLQETVVAWLKAHQEAQREIAAQVALRAFNDKYLCSGESK